MRDDGKGITMKNIIKNLVKELKEDKQLGGIGKRFVYIITDKQDSCKVIIGSYESLRRNLNLKSLDENQKNKESQKILKRELTGLNYMLVTNSESKFPIICLENNDLQKSKIKYLIVEREDKKEVKGKIIAPIIYDENKEELVILLSEKVIKRNEIIFEVRITPDTKLLGVSEDDIFITLR